MKTVGVFDAKTHLSQLIEAGEPVTITKHGKPVATLMPVRQRAAEVIARIREMRKFGGVAVSEREILKMTRESRR